MADIVVNGNTSGAVTLSAPAVAGTVTVTLPATSGTMLTTASSTGVSGSAISSGTVAEAYGGTGTSTGYYGFKSRIINGAMVIDQRNAGASVTPTTGSYTLDRWLYSGTNASKASVQQNAGSVTPPAGFTNYLGVTSLSAYALTGTESYSIQQRLEGFNTADLNFGTASATNLTLSFWVRSSLTGTFGGEIFGNPTRAYPFTYSIPTANTWTYITIAIAGDTTVNTYNTTNGFSLILVFGLGASGTATGGTVNTWQNGNFTQPAGTVSVVSTNAATWFVTGVQLEKGSTATSFDYRPYGTELQLAQRYYFKNMPAVAGSNVATGVFNGTTNLVITPILPVPMRIAPTMTQLTMSVANGVTANAVTSIGTQTFGTNSGLVVMNGTSASYATGQAGYLFTQATSSYVDFSAEL